MTVQSPSQPAFAHCASGAWDRLKIRVSSGRVSHVSYLEAAEAVLKSSKRPLTTREIVAKALARGLIAPTGKTPEASMSARLYVHVRDHPGGRIRREFEPGRGRARRDSVRWLYRR